MQQQKVDEELVLLQKAFGQLDQRIGQARVDIDSLHQLSRDVEEIAVDGLMVLGASSLEGWAKRATANNRFPRVPVRMTESYLDSVAYHLPRAEDVQSDREIELSDYQEDAKTQFKKHIVRRSESVRLFDADRETLELVEKRLQEVLVPLPYHSVNSLLSYWKGALHWIAVAQQHQGVGEPQDKELPEELTKQIETYRPRIELLQHRYDRSKDQARPLLAEVREALNHTPWQIIE